MSETVQFRAALHGYNREDVVAYIDRVNREHDDNLRRLQAQNDQLRAHVSQLQEALNNASDNTETEKALSDAQTLVTDLRSRNTELEDRIRELEEALENARAEQESETVPMSIPQDLSAPIPPVAEVIPSVAPAKDYTELELAAYRRAEMAERLAHERAGDVYQQISSVFSQANARLDTGRSDLEQLSRTLTEDVNQMLSLLTNLNSAYRQAETSFAEIGERNRSFES